MYEVGLMLHYCMPYASATLIFKASLAKAERCSNNRKHIASDGEQDLGLIKLPLKLSVVGA